MTQKFLALFVSLLFFSGLSIAQEEDPFKTRSVTDEMTVDAEQNKNWRLGQSKYSAKPRNMWELGINLGHAFTSGDVEAVFPAGWGVGLSVRKAVNYVLSFRLDGFYRSSKGLDARPIRYSTLTKERTFLQNQEKSGTGDLTVYDGSLVHRNYKTNIFGGSISVILNIGNMLFHQESNKWNIYGVAGFGVHSPDVNVNLFDNNGAPYNFESAIVELDLDLKDDRKEARKILRDLLDDDYETEGGVEQRISKIADDKTLIGHINLGVGISRKLSSKVNLSLEHEFLLSDDDLLDGFEQRTATDATSGRDIPHYTNIRLNINLGDPETKTEPLYWLNPLDAPMNDIAELKQRPKFDLTDSDGDGVIDMIDQEPNTVAGAPVDARGMALDSDGDGIMDYRDKEPYSPPGYTTDGDGVAQLPDDPYLTEDEIVDLIVARIPDVEWFLPMIHFDLDKYYVKPEFYGQLHHVAQVMQRHPNLKVVAVGHTDNRSAGDYNQMLSYNRALAAIDYITANYDIPRDRLILNYGGEGTTLVSDLPDNHRTTKHEEMQHYMNRRVEFRVATAADQDMPRPDGPSAGQATPRSSRAGTKYSGNKNSGY